ncbi:hypothetical protein MRB53_018322 [Persea americana]|uniref:Uncharacterized protein n=1 Tax=Persea americana TaxID=3435 RepID=A0ACC2M899_PERAE|nr:hypothetical protein MRB53_018322 [Persea americana]
MENGWWRGGGRKRKLILLALFSPLLLPLICVSCPLICIAIFCLRFQPTPTPTRHQPPRCCEESAVAGPFETGGLLQRYLQDQLDLVRSIYNCEDSSENDGGGARLNLFP